MRPVILPLALCGAALLATFALARPHESAAKVRVGTYDSRAIAVAYAPSKFNPVGEKRRELEAAKAAGDTERVAELEAWGPKHQRALHRQGFGRVPVDDLLAHVADRLPEAARAAGVDVIVFDCSWAGPEVEVVDVTHELVALFDPSERTLTTVEELLEHEPVDLDEIEGHQDDH